MHDGIDHAVEKIAVVRYDDQGTAVAFQPVFEPDDGVEVEVVGRLIEQQQVGWAHQRLREVKPHAPAARKARHRQLTLAGGETKAREKALGPRARGVERSEEHTSELQSPCNLVCRLLLEKKKTKYK